MKVQKEFYADILNRIHFAGGMIRLDLATLQPDTTGNQAPPVPQENKHLVIGLYGFIRLYDTMLELIHRLEEAGIVVKNVREKLDD